MKGGFFGARRGARAWPRNPWPPTTTRQPVHHHHHRYQPRTHRSGFFSGLCKPDLGTERMASTKP